LPHVMTTEEIIYGEAVRAIQQQEGSVDELRSRASGMLTAVSVAAAFFGTNALKSRYGLGGWGHVAVAASAISAAGPLAILWPGRGWIFSNDMSITIEDVSEQAREPDDVHMQLAGFIVGHFNDNQSRLDKLYWALRVAIIFLVVALAAWLVQLGEH
jgi:hypothetical protein